MYVLHAEERDLKTSVKKLRKEGFIPGSVYGKNLGNSIPIQLYQNNVKQLVKTKTVGNSITLCVKDKTYSVIIKEISRNPVGNTIDHLGFQSLTEDEKVVSSLRIRLLNKEKVTNFIQQRLYEIPYRAYPVNLKDEIEIDLEGMPAGTVIRVEDLDMAHQEDIELLTDPEALVLTIDGSRKPAHS